MTTPNQPTSMHRSYDVQRAYVEHLEKRNSTNDTSCDMCRLIIEKPVVLEGRELKYVSVIENEFPYMNNDGRQVLLHHMIVPRNHCAKNAELSEETRKELHDTIDALLDDGTYHSAYSRSSYNPATSVPLHLHTHLFKFGAKLQKQVFDSASGLNDIEFEES
jgi:hypothetical protein